MVNVVLFFLRREVPVPLLYKGLSLEGVAIEGDRGSYLKHLRTSVPPTSLSPLRSRRMARPRRLMCLIKAVKLLRSPPGGKTIPTPPNTVTDKHVIAELVRRSLTRPRTHGRVNKHETQTSEIPGSKPES